MFWYVFNDVIYDVGFLWYGLTMKNFFYYLVEFLAVVAIFVASFILSIFFYTDPTAKAFVAGPGVASLFLFLYEIYRLNRKHEQKVELQNKNQDFVIGIASHMAQVAYDKHVDFCEEYIDRLQKGLLELYQHGTSKRALVFGRELVNIRQKHSAWLTKNIERDLKPFEEALIEIGAKEHYLEMAKIDRDEHRRKETIERVYDLFIKILGDKGKPEEERKETRIAIDDIIEMIRKILGIEILTELRIKTMRKILSLGIAFLTILLFVFNLSFTTVDAATWVSGYYRSDGTYVRGHYRSEPNGLKYDNYSWSYGDDLYNDSYYSSGRSSNWYTPSYTWDSDYYTGYNYNQNNLGSSFNNSYAESYYGGSSNYSNSYYNDPYSYDYYDYYSW